MSRQCEFTGKKALNGNLVSHANNRTKHKQELNLQNKKYFIPELSRSVTLRLTSRAIRTISKYGTLSNALRKSGGTDLSDRLSKIKRQLTA